MQWKKLEQNRHRINKRLITQVNDHWVDEQHKIAFKHHIGKDTGMNCLKPKMRESVDGSARAQGTGMRKRRMEPKMQENSEDTAGAQENIDKTTDAPESFDNKTRAQGTRATKRRKIF